MFARLHILMAPHVTTAACEVAPGESHDSPVFRDGLLPQVPDGTGCVIPDAACDSHAGYSAHS